MRRLGYAVLALITAVVTVDVLATGPLTRWDRRLMLGPDGLKVTGWQFDLWRVVVTAGQFWLVGSAVMIAAALVAWLRRRPLLFVAVGAWLGAVNLVIWVFKKAVGRTAPASGVDLLHTAAESFPSGHSAIGASCLLTIAALVTGAAGRYATPVAHVIIAGVAVATVMLGYHWPTDAIAGWSFGILLGLAGAATVRRWG
jgi:membrane-associated phospholipid phosphatase